MDDVTARIAIAVQAGDSLRQIGRVKEGIKGITDQRLKDLRLAQSAAKLELAEYKSMLAAQKSYNAEIHMAGTEKRIKFRKSAGAKPDELEKMTRLYDKQRETYLKAQSAEASANLVAYQAKVSHDDLKKSLSDTANATGKAAKGMREYSASTIAARSASRLLGIDIGEGVNPSMIKMGIIAAGVASAVKVGRAAYDLYIDKLKYATEISRQNYEENRKLSESHRELADKTRNSFATLERMNNQDSLSYVDRFKMGEIIKTLGDRYKDLGINIDGTTGKINNFYEAYAKIEEKLRTQELEDINRELRDIGKERKELEESREKSGFNVGKQLQKFSSFSLKLAPLGHFLPLPSEYEKSIRKVGLYDISFGGEAEANAAKRRNQELDDLEKKARQRQAELLKRKPNIKGLGEAEDKDLSKAINKQREQYRIESLRLRGKEREAKLAEITAKWEDKRFKYRGAADEFIKAEMALYDQGIEKRRKETVAEIARERFKFQPTAQNSAFADSLEALRLQSRIMTQSSGMNLSNNPQKVTAEQSKKQTNILEEVRDLLDTFINNATLISSRKM